MSTDPRPGLRLLLIEDQRDIAANIWDYLERRGHVVDHCADGIDGLARAHRGGFDAIILDLGLPRLDGLELCRRLRAAGDGVVILMLTARDTLDDKLRGYAEGADDYMVKPFALRELDARLRAIHRGRAGSPPGPDGDDALRYDAASLTAHREGRAIALTRLQGRLLDLLLAQAPRIVPHARLLDAWDGDGADLAALHTQMYELRQRVDRPFAAPCIRSVRGVGYRVMR